MTTEPPERVLSPVTWRRRWLSARSLRLHLALAVWVPGCLLADWWQVTVALSGNHLAWLYSVEWPFFGAFGAVVWWHLVHDDPETTGGRGLRRAREQADQRAVPFPRRREQEDEELARYNDFLETLSRDAPVKNWRRR